ncbi:outer membrane beta-barrel protein [Dyadobacter aurulentus]|uniref:outer membrane beta-barrel protein n=1 Tax=Dyadobacter sp. UC 10 TaxID=2605428 RepID=UPI0011F37458|nr:outer membrane beta-barrel protein [Dyadobacter sp. UC 10]KAA0992404.1 PorT family protein [Dyadobacter sp. UC 10]
MKNAILLLLSLFFLARSLHAQEARSFRKFGLGIYGGPQILGKIYDNDKLSKISGAAVGLDFRYAFSKEPQGFSLHFQPAFNSFREFSSEGANTQVYRETTWRWKAFHLPLLARYTISSGKVRPFAELGPMLRFRTALTVKQGGTICGVAGCGPIGLADNIHPETSRDPVGFIAGAGVEVDLWKITVPVAVRIQEGFGTYKMESVRYDGPYYYEKFKTRTIQVTVGVAWP